MPEMELSEYMKRAIDEAKDSLRQGNNGFGAVVVRDRQIISAAYDLEETEDDPTSHAEMNAIREACKSSEKILPDVFWFPLMSPVPCVPPL